MQGTVGVPAKPDCHHRQLLAVGANQSSLGAVKVPIVV
jgi:hypothetical protein